MPRGGGGGSGGVQFANNIIFLTTWLRAKGDQRGGNLKQENKKVRKQETKLSTKKAIKTKKRKHALDQESDQK